MRSSQTRTSAITSDSESAFDISRAGSAPSTAWVTRALIVPSAPRHALIIRVLPVAVSSVIPKRYQASARVLSIFDLPKRSKTSVEGEILRKQKRGWVGVVVLAVIISACGGGDGSNAPTTSSGSGPVLPNLAGLSDECASLANLMAGIVQVFGGSTENVDQLFAAADSGLPPGIQADVDIVKDVTQEFITATGGEGVDFGDLANSTPEELAQLEQAMAILDQDEVNGAFDRIAEYGQQACAEFVESP